MCPDKKRSYQKGLAMQIGSDRDAPRLLGAAFLVVILTSLTSGLLLDSAVGSGSMSEILVRISHNVDMMRISNVVDLVTSLGIVVLAVLLYVVLHKQNEIFALVALGLWLAEAAFLATSKVAAFALASLSLDFVKAGSPAQSVYQVLGDSLYNGLYAQAYSVHMWFYCLGGMLWYGLFFRSRLIPRAISSFGLLAVSVALLGITLGFLGNDVRIVAYLPILPFELAIGVWLVLRGTRITSPDEASA